jgi:hypothetical protein
MQHQRFPAKLAHAFVAAAHAPGQSARQYYTCHALLN